MSLWADPKIQKLVSENFIPATDEVWRLQNRPGPDCKLFMKFADKGHYGGRSNTRQGIYVASPSGEFLGSNNHRDPRRVETMLLDALKKWKALEKKDRYLSDDPKKTTGISHPRDQYPVGGLILRAFTRDLPRNDLPDDWRRIAWNQDYCWYKKDEAQKFLPNRPKKGQTFQVPQAVFERIVRCNFVDNVRGQTVSYAADAVKTAELNGKIERIKKGKVEVTFTGKSRTEQDGRGIEVSVRGEATFDAKKMAFTEFELVAIGSRWGRTRYNFRQDDEGKTPIGFVLKLAGDERVAPAGLGSYGW